MLHIIALIACVLLCAIGFRVRGGCLAGTRYQLPGQISRLTFALAASLTAYVAGASWPVALALVPAWWLSCLPGWSHSIDLGANEDTFWRDFVVLSVRGALWGVLPALVLWAALGLLILPTADHGLDVTIWRTGEFARWWVLPLFGLLLGPAYVLARAIRIGGPGLGTAVDYVPRGEVLAGAIFGIGTIAAVTL